MANQAQQKKMTTIHFRKSKSKSNLAASGGSKNNPKRRASRSRVPTSYSRFSGSPRIGIKTRFQAHSALESNTYFRLTFGLENADRLTERNETERRKRE